MRIMLSRAGKLMIEMVFNFKLLRLSNESIDELLEEIHRSDMSDIEFRMT